MGGDHGARVVTEGAVLACRELEVEVSLTGPEDLLRRELQRLEGGGLPIEVLDAPDVVGMAEKVSRSVLKKRSSIQVGLERVQNRKADAFFSSGNTAACWTIARMVLGTLEEVDRPALAAVLPSREGQTVLLDVGANTRCKARNLEEFAVMGSAYSRGVLLGGPLDGVDALYATVQMPPGIPVGTMAIGSGGARNAGIYAVQILALQYPELEAKLQAYKTKLSDGVAEKAARLQEVGYQNY